ncbi:hypothetical protein VKI21_06870 [Cyanobacterium aponinum UTEX 3222]|uniref:hypothetical protein n=1 Tax=Cyanobacterium aponinum TaxID=379064 RepID=UPI00308CECB3|nr:hypothetical protein VKI21_06870 [Cyanobacterium aponinum UTEX 3222]
MLQWILKHLDGLIILFTACLIPLSVWLGKQCKEDILSEAEKHLNGATKRLDHEISILKEKLGLMKQELSYVDSKQDMINENLKEQLNSISVELEKLEALKVELQGTRELMLLQNNSFTQQLNDFKDFIKSNIFNKP